MGAVQEERRMYWHFLMGAFTSPSFPSYNEFVMLIDSSSWIVSSSWLWCTQNLEDDIGVKCIPAWREMKMMTRVATYMIIIERFRKMWWVITWFQIDNNPEKLFWFPINSISTSTYRVFVNNDPRDENFDTRRRYWISCCEWKLIVIWLTLDTLRSDHNGTFGYQGL